MEGWGEMKKEFQNQFHAQEEMGLCSYPTVFSSCQKKLILTNKYATDQYMLILDFSGKERKHHGGEQ